MAKHVYYAPRTCTGSLQFVVKRRTTANYTVDVLACGHRVTDHDNRRPKRRRCTGWEER